MGLSTVEVRMEEVGENSDSVYCTMTTVSYTVFGIDIEHVCRISNASVTSKPKIFKSIWNITFETSKLFERFLNFVKFELHGPLIEIVNCI